MKALIKAAALMLAGAALLLTVEAAWIVDAGFIVRKTDADARRQRDETYSLAASNPADEFAGLGDGEWSK